MQAVRAKPEADHLRRRGGDVRPRRANAHVLWRCELRDHGEYGVEAQFLDPVEIRLARTFRRQDMDPGRSPRAMAIAWGEEERKAMEVPPPWM